MQRPSLGTTWAFGAALFALAVVAGAQGASRAVSFTVQGRSVGTVTVRAGTTVAMAARAALKPGYTLAIFAARQGESRERVVAACRKSTCTGKWRETASAAVQFVAVVVRGSGASAKLVDKSKVIGVKWEAAGPPQPYATPGHYEGRSSQNELFAFDVAAGGRQVANLKTGQVNTGCPGGAHTWSGNLSLPGPWPIKADHSFSIVTKNEPITSAQDEAIKRSITIAGAFSGTVATGTLLVEFDWPSLGGICTTGPQTWTISRVG